MGKFLFGLATGVALVFLTIVLLAIAAMRFRERPPDIASDSVLVLRLEGEIPERAPVEWPLLSSDNSGVTMANVWMALRKAAADPHIRAVALEPDGLEIGWGKLQEIRG